MQCNAMQCNETERNGKSLNAIGPPIKGLAAVLRRVNARLQRGNKRNGSFSMYIAARTLKTDLMSFNCNLSLMVG